MGKGKKDKRDLGTAGFLWELVKTIVKQPPQGGSKRGKK